MTQLQLAQLSADIKALRDQVQQLQQEMAERRDWERGLAREIQSDQDHAARWEAKIEGRLAQLEDEQADRRFEADLSRLY